MRHVRCTGYKTHFTKNSKEMVMNNREAQTDPNTHMYTIRDEK